MTTKTTATYSNNCLATSSTQRFDRATRLPVVGVFLRNVYMFSSNIITIVAILVFSTLASASDMGVHYVANRGDCLSGIIKAHYPDATGHNFVSEANPDIVDANKITVGQHILLPGLDAKRLQTQIDQTGCNAASLSLRTNNQQTVDLNAAAVVESHAPHPNSATTVRDNQAVDDRQNYIVAAPLKGAVRGPFAKVAASDRVVAGTVAVPVDLSQRTKAGRAHGRPTQVATPMPAAPRFAVDEPLDLTTQRHHRSTPNRYVVNAIGARANSAEAALVQHPDQHFYVQARSSWQAAEKPATPLDEALAQQADAATVHTESIFIDAALLMKAAAQSGVKP